MSVPLKQLALLATACVVASCAKEQQTDAGVPRLRWSVLELGAVDQPGMATLGDRVILFGGLRGNLLTDETWQWDGTSWTNLHPKRRPPARERHGMAGVQGRVVLFGGRTAAETLEDTWEFDGSDWVQRFPPLHPTGTGSRNGAFAMAGVGNKVVWFGGPDNETWEWAGETWVNKTPSRSPPQRRGAAMAARGSNVVLFGGATDRGPPNFGDRYLGDTWEWDGATWTELSPPSSPSPRASSAASLGATVLLQGGVGDGAGGTGGGGGGGSPPPAPVGLDDTWSWDGTTWTRLEPQARPAAGGFSMAALGQRAVVVGRGKEWVWTGQDWSQRGRAERLVRPFIDTPLGFASFADQVVAVDDRGTWTYTEAEGWRREATKTTPPLTALCSWNDRVVMFGQQTWSWRGGDWQLIATEALDASVPDASVSGPQTLVYVTRGPRLFEVGASVREFDGTRWKSVANVGRPPDVYWLQLAGTPSRVMGFGVGMAGPEAWEWQGSTWARADDGFGASSANTLFAVEDQLYVFGERSGDGGVATGLWRWTGAGWERVEVEGPSPVTRPRVGSALPVFEGTVQATAAGEAFFFEGFTLSGGVWKLSRVDGRLPR